MDDVREAFQKVKKDILSLNKDLFEIKQDLGDIIHEISTLKQLYFDEKNKANKVKNPTETEENPAHNTGFKPLKPQISPISIGNVGVPADRQTNQQTDRHINSNKNTHNDPFDNALKTLESLDNAKKEIRRKFKNLTEKEFLVFTTIYQLELEGIREITYSKVSDRLNLTESSIRDYVGKICKKGAPLDKLKENNKTVFLSISQNFQKVASLETLFKLREL
ncbi:MAG: hypothetical protein WDZ77_00855 [Candidatus Pacearchaeota archaeon]